ncbi:MAG TPA: Tm-1-like ATP-binding domain-containing protein [Desulfomonilaceae bacterium]|nr:Tm-1-like ATP-binding domain-containing protein [Desulfomonilaceae bacterium]HVN77687.1 Tm-1-like ATP-binding domain-containing protein [Terriglobia bacterium]
MERFVLLISTLDTKGPETLYLRDRIRDLGGNPLVLDLSMSGASHAADITSASVAEAAGTTIQEIQLSRERKTITRQMITGAVKLTRDLLESGRLAGVIGLGGSTGSLMATDIMRSLPFGVPKLMVSSTAALPGLATRYIGTGDIAILHTVIEISGLARPLQNLLDRAAGAIVGMASCPSLTVDSARQKGRPLVAMSMFGPTERCAHSVQQRLESAGFQLIGFSAAGVCDRAMEEMIAQRFFDAVVDLAPGGVGEEVLGGMRAAGPDRMTAAGRLGIPQVIAPGGVNLTSPRKSRYKPEHHQRRKFELDELRTFLRVSDEEMDQIAHVFAEKLNQATGPALLLFPGKGWSAVDPPDGHMFDKEQDRVFLRILKENTGPHLGIREVDANLEDAAFAEEVVKACIEIFPKPETKEAGDVFYAAQQEGSVLVGSERRTP